MTSGVTTAIRVISAVRSLAYPEIVINAGFSCPNRDGTLSYGGCTFAVMKPLLLNTGLAKASGSSCRRVLNFTGNRYRQADRYLAYFQSFPIPMPLIAENCFAEAFELPKWQGIIVGTVRLH